MAEINRKPVVYSYGAEGRDACWAALTNSWKDYARRQNQFSSDESRLESWPPSEPAETGEIDSTTTTTTAAAAAAAITYAVSDVNATTPPPPPMMRSPPRIRRPRRSSSARNEWSAQSCVFRPLDLDLADSCVAEVDGSGRKDDAAEDEWSSAGCYPEDLRPLTPASLPAAVAAAADEDEWTAVDAFVKEEPTTTEFEDEMTITADVVDIVARAEPSSPPSPPPSPPLTPGRTGEGPAFIPNEQTVDKLPLPPPPPSVAYEMKIKEIDDTIVSYSKSLLITVLVVVLIRVLF